MVEHQKSAETRVFAIVKMIPVGHVATYGQVAKLAGMPSHARLVGRILSQLPTGTQLPWHRVVNSQGLITNPSVQRQQKRLEDEGVTLINGRVSLRIYGWHTA
jgi:methylated-DNA-protein-cysteine methyltransferase-like protein